MRVFVSYARADGDAAFVNRLVESLKASSIDLWIDVEQLEPGQLWPAQIDEAIRRSGALIALLSANGSASPYVTYEWSFAYGAGVPVLPLLLEDGVQVHPRLGQVQAIECWRDEGDALRRVGRWLCERSDPTWREAERIGRRLEGASSEGKEALLRELWTMGGHGRNVATAYVDRALAGVRGAKTPAAVEEELAALETLHALGVPDIAPRLIALSHELAGDPLRHGPVAMSAFRLIRRQPT